MLKNIKENMKTVITLACLIMSSTLWAQEYKLAKNSGTLSIKEVGDVKIEGYAGDEIIFASRSFKGDRDDRAKGLKAISSLGLEDNTGIGLSVIENDNVIEVKQLKKMDGPDILIKVPKGVKIIYSHTSPHGSDVRINDVDNDIDISTVHNDVVVENARGPVRIRTVHGDVEATFAGVSNPVSISSTHGHVDVSIPTTTKANLKLSTTWGEIFVDPDLKLEIDKAGDLIKYSDKLAAKLNGGGIDISLSSTHDNVYLRKK